MIRSVTGEVISVTFLLNNKCVTIICVERFFRFIYLFILYFVFIYFISYTQLTDHRV